MLPASSPVAMLACRSADASALTREVFQTLSVHFFPATALGLSADNPKDISSTVGDGWVKWMDYSADGIQHVAAENVSAQMVKSFACLLLKNMTRIMPSATEILLQLLPLREQIRVIYSSCRHQSERKKAFKAAIETVGSAHADAEFPVWTVLPQMLSFCASIAASKLRGKTPEELAKIGKLVDDCRSLISVAQHALCDMFFNRSRIGGSVSPHQLMFGSAECPNGLLCATVPDNAKCQDNPLNWIDVNCVNCSRPAAAHTLRFSHDDLQSQDKDEKVEFVRALCRIGSIGWHSHRFMAAVHSERSGNLAAFSRKACEESLKKYDEHMSFNCLSDVAAAASCQQCKPYSLKKCCKLLPHYAAAITEEANALKAARREELDRVTDAFSGAPQQPPPSQARSANRASNVPANAGAGGKQQHAPTRVSADPALSPSPKEAAAASLAQTAQHEAAEDAPQVSPHVASAPAVQPPADEEAARLQQLFQILGIENMERTQQQAWIVQNASEISAKVSDKKDRALLNTFARGPPSKKDKPKPDQPQNVAPTAGTGGAAAIDHAPKAKVAGPASPPDPTPAPAPAPAPAPVPSHAMSAALAAEKGKSKLLQPEVGTRTAASDDAGSVDPYIGNAAAGINEAQVTYLAPPSPVPLPQLSVAAGPVLLSLDDLRVVTAQALGDEMAAISPDFACYRDLLMSAGFDGMLLCDVVDDADLQQLVQALAIGNLIHRRRVLAQLRAVRARFQQPTGP